MDQPDPDILDRCRSGDPTAWTRLVRRYGGLVYAIARRSGLDEHACDDVAQAVFAKLAGSLPHLREPAALPGWLATTSKREAWRLAAERRRAPEALSQPPAQAPETADLVEHHRLRAAMEDLGGRCRDLLHALYFRPVRPSYEEISDLLDLPVGSIGPTRQRCLAKLAALLGQRDEDRSKEFPPRGVS